MDTANDLSSDIKQELLGLLIAGFEGTVLTDEFRHALDAGLAGIILFARNYRDRKQLTTLSEEILSHNSDAIIAVDQEGGRVTRFAGDFPAFPSPGYFGSHNDLDGLLHATRITAISLRECGVNCNLTPVCDLQPQGHTNVVFNRAYSMDPDQCAHAVQQQIDILRENGLITCAKHFPGLASAVGDPHFLISHSDRTHTEFRESDFIPFRAAIESGCDMVMPTHLLAPNLDSDNIATFSSKIIENELRGHLGFDRVVVTDDLQMLGALEKNDLPGAAIKSLSAGCDLLIYGNLSGSVGSLIDEVVQRVELDANFLSILSRRTDRVRKLRSSGS